MTRSMQDIIEDMEEEFIALLCFTLMILGAAGFVFMLYYLWMHGGRIYAFILICVFSVPSLAFVAWHKRELVAEELGRRL